MASDVERRLKELEAEVVSERAQAQVPAVRPPAEAAVAPRVESRPRRTREAGPDGEPRRGWLRFPKSVLGKVVVFGGLLVAGLIGVWLLKKLVAIALWVGGTLAVAAILYWWIFKKPRK